MFVLIPAIILFTVVDLLFLWALVIQLLGYLILSSRTRLFNCLTCNIWQPKDFHEKYMSDANDKDDIFEENKDEATLNTKLNHPVIKDDN